MSTTFETHILIDIYKEGTEEERICLVRVYNPYKVKIEELKTWLNNAGKNHTRYIGPFVCFNAYTDKELFDEV